jgi:hypothetical protein
VSVVRFRLAVSKIASLMTGFIIKRMVLKLCGRANAALLWFSICVAILPGCNRGPVMYDVGGTVLYTDGSVPKGAVAVVRLQPSGNSTAEIRSGATGSIGPDGSFELYTRVPGDGVYEGQYDVTFAVLKSIVDPVSLIPAKYSNPTTSGYTVTVDQDIDDLKFEIEPLAGAGRSAAAGGAVSR